MTFFDRTLLILLRNHVVLMLIRSFKAEIKTAKGRRFVSKQGQPQPHFPSEARLLSPQL